MSSNEEKIKALKYAYRILSVRERTFFEMRQKLNKKGFNKKITEDVIKELTEQNLLNDKRFAEMWTKEKIQWHPCGRFLIFKQLTERGAPKEIIEKTLKKLLPISKEIELAKIVLERKKKTLKKESFPYGKLYQKMAMFLKSKGFSGEAIAEAMENLE